jgi:hypothetical protein
MQGAGSEFGKFVLNAFGISLSADGYVALWLAVPVAFLIVAIAYRIARPHSKASMSARDAVTPLRRAAMEDHHNLQVRSRRSTFPETPPQLAHRAEAVLGDGTGPRDT